MAINIPQVVFDKYFEFCNYLLESDNFSEVCTIYYPPIKETCSNCVNLAGTTSNNYSHGGPAPFSFNNNCELCGGAGFREKEVTDTIRLRTYWSRKDWRKFGTIAIPEAACMVIGKVEDLPKLLQAKDIVLASDETTLQARYRLAGQPFFNGFGPNTYFIAYLQK